MCRALAAGGRRCTAVHDLDKHERAQLNALRRAKYAASVARSAAEPPDPTWGATPVPDPLPELPWDGAREKVHEIRAELASMSERTAWGEHHPVAGFVPTLEGFGLRR